MKICVLTHTFPRNKNDVAAAFMDGFCKSLVENGNKVVLVTPFDEKFDRSGDPYRIITYKYIWPSKLHLLGYSRTMEGDINLKKRSFFLLPFLLFFGFFTLLKTVNEEKVDLINVHWIIPNGLMALIVSKVTRVPFVVTLPGTDTYLAYRYKLFGWFARLIAQHSSGIISNSSWHLTRILQLGVTGKKTAVISYPTDVSAYRPLTSGVDSLRRYYGFTKDNLIVLAVGRLVYKKGFDYLIRAMQYIRKKYPHVRLVIGGEGDLRKIWENLAERLDVADVVLFIGTIKRDEIISYYNLADIMVAPSIVDKYGNVDGGPVTAFESMACGKPQIVTNVLGVADVMKDGVNGFIVRQKDTRALANALERLITSTDLRKKMGEANKRLVQTYLSTKSIGEQYTAFFKQALKS